MRVIVAIIVAAMVGWWLIGLICDTASTLTVQEEINRHASLHD